MDNKSNKSAKLISFREMNLKIETSCKGQESIKENDTANLEKNQTERAGNLHQPLDSLTHQRAECKKTTVLQTVDATCTQQVTPCSRTN